MIVMSIHLSPRLLAVAKLVPSGARVIDVGTDHGRVPVWLAQNGIAAHIVASDIRLGPLGSAEELVKRSGVKDRVSLRLADGLSGLGPEDGEVVIMAGMGGETMISVLDAAPWALAGALLILEPQSKQAELRRFLIENGVAITSEKLVRDAGRIYPILTAEAGQSEPYTEAELHTGAYGMIAADPLFAEYLEGLLRRTEAAAPYDPAAERLAVELKAMERRRVICQA